MINEGPISYQPNNQSDAAFRASMRVDHYIIHYIPNMRTQSRNALGQAGAAEEVMDFSGTLFEGSTDKGKPQLLLPAKRSMGFSEIGSKKPKTLPVSYEDWEPFSKVLLNLEFKAEDEQLSDKDLKERKNIALRMSTPEGLAEIINELEGKLSQYEDLPLDPDFESLSMEEKIEKLFQDFLVIN